MKILFTDLDGTLLNDSVKVSEYTKDILQKFISAGNLVVPTSGRPLLSMQKVMESSGLAPFVSYLIAYNGALIWDTQKQAPVREWTITRNQASVIQKVCEEMGIHFQTYEDEQLITHTMDEEILSYTQNIHLPIICSPDPSSRLTKDPYKALCIHLTDHDMLCKLRDNADEATGRVLTIQFSNPRYLEFFNKDAGKGNAITTLSNLLGADHKDTYAAGDEENDISMLIAAGCGIAMANARDFVKSTADVVTEFTNDEDGLARFIETLLPQEP